MLKRIRGPIVADGLLPNRREQHLNWHWRILSKSVLILGKLPTRMLPEIGLI
ncbi:hypothetical protein OROMI_021737 [Orobanche minor]